MKTEIALNSTVCTPVTDAEGEQSFVMGTLISLNSRMAHVQTADGVVKVGKTKIDLVAAPKTEDEDKPKIDRIADDYEYTQTRSASGRISCDNADDVAQTLRGNTLDRNYNLVANTIGQSAPALMARYAHLNPGQQRMCLGNLLRGWIRKQNKEA